MYVCVYVSFRVTQHEESLEKTLEKIQGYESRNETVRVVRVSAGTSARVTHDDQREKHRFPRRHSALGSAALRWVLQPVIGDR